MSNLGRPTAYKPEYCELAHNYCLLGRDGRRTGGVLRRHPRYDQQLDRHHPRIRDGACMRDATLQMPESARKLFARALGYSHKVERTVLHRGVERTIYQTPWHYPPDTQACIFWLRNR